MVQKKQKETGDYYKCEVCGLLYSDKETAQKCQAWCSEHNSCNLDIIKYAVPKETLEG